MHRRLFVTLLCALPALAGAEQSGPYRLAQDNLTVVLRETFGGPVPKSGTLTPMGSAKFKLPDGKEVEVDMAHFSPLGDMHLRFVFDGPHSMRNATPQDLERQGLTPEEALQVAVADIRRVYGPPRVKPIAAGLKAVEGGSPDLDRSYFLDKTFWNELLRQP